MQPNTATATLPGTATTLEGAHQNPRSLGYLVDRLSNMRTPIKGSLMIIGRETGLVLDGISRKHCMIRIEEGEAHVADMGSRYGTFLNDEKLAPNAWRVFSPADELRLGGSAFRIELPARAKAVKEKAAKPVEHIRKEKTQSKELPEGLEIASFHDRFRGAAVNNIISAIVGLIIGLVMPKGMHWSLLQSFIVMTACTYVPMIFWNQSLGKRIAGLKVVMDDGSPLDWQMVLFRELIMKFSPPAIAAVGLITLAGVNEIFFLALMIAIPIGFVVKTRMDGMPYWDIVCGTRVVLVESEEASEAEGQTEGAGASA